MSHETRKVRQTRRRGLGYVAYQISQTNAERLRSIIVENIPPGQRSQRGSRNSGIADVGDLDNLVLGVFEGVPATQKSVFEVPTGPDRIVLYQKNIEAVCSNEDEIRREIRLTVIHELGHYFGMTEAQLEGI